MRQQEHSTAMTPTDTYFASLERSDMHQVRTLNTTIESAAYIKTLIDAMPFVVILLNSHRQVVAANEKLCLLLGVGIENALGFRPGELVDCIHAGNGPNGCGTDNHCRVCGAVNAILGSMNTNTKVSEECRITLKDGGALDWEVTASPLVVENHSLVCLGIRDISHEKRRRCLERAFFHDIINKLGAVIGFLGIMADEYTGSEEITEAKTFSDELLEEIRAHQAMALAENGDLTPKFEQVDLTSLLGRLIQLYQSHPVAEQCSIRASIPKTLTVTTDAVLLKRVLGNMLKNAIEASACGQTVTMSCACQADGVAISVHNAGVISQDIQLQIFNRSFTTKSGIGRGTGTYSMKLLGEKYLKGQVSFESDEQAGTVFTIALPRQAHS